MIERATHMPGDAALFNQIAVIERKETKREGREREKERSEYSAIGWG